MDPVEKICNTICTFCQILMDVRKEKGKQCIQFEGQGQVGRCWHRFKDYTKSSYEKLGRTVRRKQVMGFAEKILKLQTSFIKGSKS